MVSATVQQQPQQQDNVMIKLRGNVSAISRLFSKDSKHRRSHSQQYHPVSQRVQEDQSVPVAQEGNKTPVSKKSLHKRSKSAPIKSSKLNNGKVYEVNVEQSDTDVEMTDAVKVSSTKQLMVRGILKTTSTESVESSNITTQKQFRFNEIVLVGEAHSSQEYERKSDFQLVLTPSLAYMIKRELNEFKSHEMQVHEDSRCNTQIYKV